jgi:hypothetical protein
VPATLTNYATATSWLATEAGRNFWQAIGGEPPDLICRNVDTDPHLCCAQQAMIDGPLQSVNVDRQGLCGLLDGVGQTLDGWLRQSFPHVPGNPAGRYHCSRYRLL